LPSDPKLLTAEAKSAAIAREAGVSAQLRRVKSKARAAGVYNEKLPVSAMPAGSYNTGIGELTSLNSYVERVLKEAGVRGFTMQDLHSPKNTMAGNWLLIDWLSVPGAAGIITKEDIAADISENENVSAQAVAERKTAAAKKVYEKLNDEQKAAVDNYYAANASWLDGYKDANDASYVKVAAMQQMFFERQLKQILSQINGMRVSMRLSGVTSANAKQVLGKWIDLGITSFTVEAERIDKAALDAIAAAASESGMTIDIAVKADAKDFNSAKKIFEAGFTPVVPLRDMNKYGVEARSAIAEIDNDSLKANPDLAKFLAENVSSGARYVEYPIGLLWGDKIDFEKFEEYRVPAQSKRKGLGSLFGLGQKTFEESYAGSYETAYSKGRNDIDVSDASFDASSLASVNVKINGQFKSIPAAAAAALLGSMAKQRRLSSIEDFATTSLSVMKALGSEKTLAPAFKYVYEALTSYNNEKDSQRKEIIEAKVAGFICGLSENLIISNAGSKFISEDLAGMYAKIVAEKSLFDAGIYPAGLDGNITAVEKIMLKADAVLAEKTLKLSAGEIKPLLSNLILAAEKTNFTFGSLDFGNLGFDKNRSAELSKVYAGAAEIMKLVFADAKVQEDSVKKSVAKIQLDAFKTMLAAA
ncbi:MAG: hypothetical protein FWC57_03320, partial [Endomicrobia bacterium]|nr:hypothetical protein [Endomicrobiia bacterium]